MKTLEFRTLATEGQIDPLFYILDEDTYSIYKRELNIFYKMQGEVYFKIHGKNKNEDFSFEKLDELGKKWKKVDETMESIGFIRNESVFETPNFKMEEIRSGEEIFRNGAQGPFSQNEVIIKVTMKM